MDPRPSHLRHAHAEPLAAEIVDLLEHVVEATQTFLIIGLPRIGRFVQFVCKSGCRLQGETVGPEYLDDFDARLDEHDDRNLMRLGWQPAGSGGVGCGNYWRVWEPPNVPEAAQLAAVTLTLVHGLAHPSQATLTWGSTESWDDPAAWDSDVDLVTPTSRPDSAEHVR